MMGACGRDRNARRERRKRRRLQTRSAFLFSSEEDLFGLSTRSLDARERGFDHEAFTGGRRGQHEPSTARGWFGRRG